MAADGERLHVWAGGGITWDSDPDAEVAEAAAKAAPIRSALYGGQGPHDQRRYIDSMTMRPIRVFGDPVLRTPAEPVTSFDAELRALVTDLMDTLLGEPGRAGVAGTADRRRRRGCSCTTPTARRGHLVNPTIEVSQESQDGEEGCLSMPGLYFPTPRAMHAVARGVDQHGEPLTVSGSGFLARALQHETDHLDGRLYVDTLRGDDPPAGAAGNSRPELGPRLTPVPGRTFGPGRWAGR